MQFATLFCIGLAAACAGSFVNWGIYSLGWFRQRAISPWSKAPAGLHRTWLDCIPILGWLRLARESEHWGRGFWIRPLLIELSLALGFAWLYRYEMAGNLIPPTQEIVTANLLLAQFASHVLLILLMTVATFIDFDEKTIPDAITIPGTLLGLVLMTCVPQALPPIEFPLGANNLYPLWLTTHRPWWPAWLDAWPGLLIANSCFAMWCYALIPKTTTLRHGWWKGWLYVHASTFRSPAWWQMGLLALGGGIAITVVWLVSNRGPGALIVNPSAWHGLLTALVGMLFGGALVWAVRIVGFLGLRKEAMGFGDVTLMAMIGAFLGWQSTLVAFFFAPVVAVVIAVLQTLFTGRRDIAFGPYLCGGALCVILSWPWLWVNYMAPIFNMGWFVPALIACLLAIMLGLLMLIRLFEEHVLGMR